MPQGLCKFLRCCPQIEEDRETEESRLVAAAPGPEYAHALLNPLCRPLCRVSNRESRMRGRYRLVACSIVTLTYLAFKVFDEQLLATALKFYNNNIEQITTEEWLDVFEISYLPTLMLANLKAWQSKVPDTALIDLIEPVFMGGLFVFLIDFLPSIIEPNNPTFLLTVGMLLAAFGLILIKNALTCPTRRAFSEAALAAHDEEHHADEGAREDCATAPV